MTNALAYLRVSGAGQADGDGFVRQREAISRYAAANDITVTEWYQDVQSGRDEWESRPGWSSMVAALNGCRTIIVEKMDRVSRAVLVQELILRDLGRREVRLITSAGDDTDDQSPERIMFRQLLAIFAAYERNTLTLKLRGARQRKREDTGRCEGRKPFGFRPGESDTLALMLSLSASGNSAVSIAAQLNQTGRPTRTGKPWRQETIAKILRRTA